MKNSFWIFSRCSSPRWFLVRLRARAGIAVGRRKTDDHSQFVRCLSVGRPGEANQGCRFIAPTAAPPATPNRSGRPVLLAT